jgi:hypothetical protein
MDKIALVFIYVFDMIISMIIDLKETWFDKEMSFIEKLSDSFFQILISAIFFIILLKLWKII